MVKDCYRLIQQIVTKRDVFCQYPGCYRRSSSGHHLFKRDRLATAFLPEAVIGLCVDHHMPQFVSSRMFKDYIATMMGGTRYEDLERLSNTIVMADEFDFKACKKHLIKILEAL
jgi:hypothetical protein